MKSLKATVQRQEMPAFSRAALPVGGTPVSPPFATSPALPDGGFLPGLSGSESKWGAKQTDIEEVEPVAYCFWGGLPTSLPSLVHGREVNVRAVINMALTECGKTRCNKGTIRLTGRQDFADFLIDAYWMIFFTVLHTLDHERLAQAHNDTARENLAKAANGGKSGTGGAEDTEANASGSSPTSRSTDARREEGVGEEVYGVDGQSFLPPIPGTPQHLTGAVSPLVSPREGQGGSRKNPQLFHDPLQEQSVLFGRMATHYRALFQSINLPIRQKDLLLKDLPDIASYALRRLFFCTLPYAKHIVSTPAFTEQILRHVSFWMSGVERGEIFTPRYKKFNKGAFHTSALVSFFAKGLAKKGGVQASASGTKQAFALQEISQGGPEQGLPTEDAIRQDLQQLKKQFASITNAGCSPEKDDSPVVVAPPVRVPSPPDPIARQQMVAWFEKGRHRGRVQVAVEGSSFQLNQQSPLLARFANDHQLGVLPSLRMTWLKPSPPSEIPLRPRNFRIQQQV